MVLTLKCSQDQCFNVLISKYSQDGQTVLHVAASAGRLETVEALLDRGCDSNVQDFVSCAIIIRLLILILLILIIIIK